MNHKKCEATSSKRNYPPCKHCGKEGHSPFKCWRRADARCNQLKHEAVICKNKGQQQEVESQIIDGEEEDQLFVETCFLSNASSESLLINSDYTNHMTYDKSLFKLQPTNITKVKIGDGKHIAEEGKGIIAFTTCSSIKTISNVLLSLKLTITY